MALQWCVINDERENTMNIQFTNDNLFQRVARKKLQTVGIDITLVANWITCVDLEGNRHTLMSEEGVDALVKQTETILAEKGKHNV